MPDTVTLTPALLDMLTDMAYSVAFIAAGQAFFPESGYVPEWDRLGPKSQANYREMARFIVSGGTVAEHFELHKNDPNVLANKVAHLSYDQATEAQKALDHIFAGVARTVAEALTMSPAMCAKVELLYSRWLEGQGKTEG